jgi:hypothetical protein
MAGISGSIPRLICESRHCTVAIENPRGFRIAKEKTTSKIDSIVALAMACVAAIERGKVDLGTLTEFNKPKPIVVNQRFDARDPDSYLKNYR